MLLRPRQKIFVERSLRALDKHGDTLGVAPTGAGKTIMLSSVVGRMLEGNDAHACVLAHRDELTAQNMLKFMSVNPTITTSIVDSRKKSWHGRTAFAMVPTLARAANLDRLPALDLLVIDEAHHAAADSYRRIIDAARERNPNVKLFGVTATANRGDRRGLRPVFSNVADQIAIGELITSGHLVRPRTFVVDVGAGKALKTVRKTQDDFDMKAVDAIMNKTPITEAVIAHWREKAGDRQTVVFCSTVDHARNVTDAFLEEGVAAAMVHGETAQAERCSVLHAFRKGRIQVVVNVAVLTEGFDHPPVSCIVLLRPSSYKSTMVQMIGRGLRTVDPNAFPGVVKTDCIMLDFGISTLLHGCLEQDVNLVGKSGDQHKDCPSCGAEVPVGVGECPLCGHIFALAGSGKGEGVEETTPLGDFVMSEIDLLKRSNFRWVDLFDDGAALVANGFNAWGGVFFRHGRHLAIGGAKGQASQLLAVGERGVCLATADDWLNANETDESAHKTRYWLNQPATEKQLQYLPREYHHAFAFTRYRASTLLTFRFNRNAIESLLAKAGNDKSKAA
ncbi:MAG: DEAD/DEAH box helicase [Hyphomicrobiales bacterium]